MLGFLLAPVEFVLVTIYAPLMSMKALGDGKISQENVHWLAFWVSWSVLNGVEKITMGIFELIPFYTELKFGLLVYMLIFDRAKVVFDKAIDPVRKKLMDVIPADYIEKLEFDPKSFIMEMAQHGKTFAQQKAKDMQEDSGSKNKKSKGK
eukprot:TRINITY_DN15912_c0_g1_i1.p1 TRINITY_DN15912_c0_g1~~TRINITY_DN15912_c0_g1_i1.p1  ORF type:complete len:150 (-),score=41.68 TRINITY_DN15912_c0_g1_i1:75-524(-)